MKRLVTAFTFLFIFKTMMLQVNNAYVVAATNFNETVGESAPAPSPQPQAKGSYNSMHGITQGSLSPQECSPQCTRRCSNTQYRKPCLFFCHKCCTKCLCVPPGTYGNKQVCPCYNNWKTKTGGPKCP